MPVVLRALVAALPLFAACSRPTPPLVVWIEVDTLRADALGCYGNASVGEDGARPSPAIDALAAEGVRFERAYTAAPWTIPSLVTQLSGRWPWEHGRTRLLEEGSPADVPFAALMRARGWRTAGVMTNFVATSRYGFHHGFERWDDSLATGHEGSTGPAAVDRLLELYDELRAEPGADPEDGVLLFALLFEPHFRYEAHDGVRFGPGYGDRADAPYTGELSGAEEMNDLLARRAELGSDDAEFLRGRYQSEVASVDRAVGRLMDGLAARGVADDALVVFVADHGEEILERGWIGHTVTLYDELVRVPWIVRLPANLRDDRAGTVVGHPVSLIDLPATLVDLATGSPPERPALGSSRSLAPTVLQDERPERRWLYLHSEFEPPLSTMSDEKSASLRGVVDARRRLKWIVDHKVPAGSDPRAGLFDLDEDPDERTNLVSSPLGQDAAAGLLKLEELRRLEDG